MWLSRYPIYTYTYNINYIYMYGDHMYGVIAMPSCKLYGHCCVETHGYICVIYICVNIYTIAHEGDDEDDDEDE